MSKRHYLAESLQQGFQLHQVLKCPNCQSLAVLLRIAHDHTVYICPCDPVDPDLDSYLTCYGCGLRHGGSCGGWEDARPYGPGLTVPK